ncbi:hypothetical protein AJ80_00836 [Polytolypa hystricis UAMH7299]|uniref:RING-type domain-containing protein n=1 Tax=Polytolypa hystricis (strain UAMH7299) TaxID=1447883 RepID=A0A2B7Z2L1_POLH7|nr:hypothetical protein AJ80_00836 [Polytolypa hystricis UAMH7299]
MRAYTDRRAMSSSLGIWWLLLTFLSSLTVAQDAHPSNATGNFAPRTGVMYNLWIQQFEFRRVNLPPLTHTLTYATISTRKSFNATGTLVHANQDNAGTLNSSHIALVSCDAFAYPTPLDVGGTIRTLVTREQPVAALILYSTESLYCNYTEPAPSPPYDNIFTLTHPTIGKAILKNLNATKDDRDLVDDQRRTSTILADMSMLVSDDGGQYESPQGGKGDKDSPTTSIAMIILYSITGIISALFLSVIVTGAIRAHLNPERYGPQNVMGRPRQSRAKGIARAMLETLPIVKFGDTEDSRNVTGKPDVELASNDEEHTDRGSVDTADGTQGLAATAGNSAGKAPTDRSQATAPAMLAVQQTPGPGNTSRGDTEPRPRTSEDAAPIGPATSPEPQAPSLESGTGTLVCPICTDEFVKGQDVRLLPCTHNFHPECIDPWLVNVSGTCPLCRIDLHPAVDDGEARPSTSGGGNTSANATQDGEDPANAAGTSTTTPSRHRRRLSTYLLHGSTTPLRGSTVEERIAAVRSLRGSHRENTTATGALETPADERSGRRFSALLRDSFRIRPRQDGGDPPPTPPPPPPPASQS